MTTNRKIVSALIIIAAILFMLMVIFSASRAEAKEAGPTIVYTGPALQIPASASLPYRTFVKAALYREPYYWNTFCWEKNPCQKRLDVDKFPRLGEFWELPPTKEGEIAYAVAVIPHWPEGMLFIFGTGKPSGCWYGLGGEVYCIDYTADNRGVKVYSNRQNNRTFEVQLVYIYVNEPNQEEPAPGQ